uniref:Uncharacterized protein n=1 Tax=Arundo donax TaxID=35708 RepID=A0A0A8XZY6_ARUDO
MLHYPTSNSKAEIWVEPEVVCNFQVHIIGRWLDHLST